METRDSCLQRFNNFISPLQNIPWLLWISWFCWGLHHNEESEIKSKQRQSQTLKCTLNPLRDCTKHTGTKCGMLWTLSPLRVRNWLACSPFPSPAVIKKDNSPRDMNIFIRRKVSRQTDAYTSVKPEHWWPNNACQCVFAPNIQIV